MPDFLSSLICLLPCYLIGAFPTGTLIAKLHKTDITKEGSGSVGATNIARTLGKKAGVLTLFIDVLKGALGAFVALSLTDDLFLAGIGGAITVAGHCFSIPGFLRGGKGVATAFGVMLHLIPLIALTSVISFAVVFGTTRIVSAASIGAAISIPIICYLFIPNNPANLGLLIVSIISIFRHRENIFRLLAGEEKKFKAKE